MKRHHDDHHGEGERCGDSDHRLNLAPDVQAPDDDRRQDLLVEAYFDDQQDDNAKYKQLLQKIEKDQLDKAIEVLSKEHATEKRAA